MLQLCIVSGLHRKSASYFHQILLTKRLLTGGIIYWEQVNVECTRKKKYFPASVFRTLSNSNDNYFCQQFYHRCLTGFFMHLQTRKIFLCYPVFIAMYLIFLLFKWYFLLSNENTFISRLQFMKT